MANRDGKKWKQWQILFSWASKSLQTVTADRKLRHLLLVRIAMTNLDSVLKSRHITLPTKVRTVKAMVFPIVMYVCDSWTIKKAEGRRINAFKLWCWRRLLRVPWTTRWSNQLILKDQSWIFIGRIDAEAPILWSPDKNSQLIGKDPDAGKDWGQEEKGATEDEMVGWYYWLNGHEFQQNQEDVKDKEAWCAAVPGIKRVRHHLVTEQQCITDFVYIWYILFSTSTRR